MTDAAFTATLVQPDGTKQNILVQRQSGEFVGQIEPDLVAAAGLYRIEATGTRASVGIGSSERQFVVMDRDKEKANPVADPDRLDRLSAETIAAGGRSIEPDELGSVLNEFIENPPIEKVKIPTTFRLGGTFEDSTAFLVVFVTVMTIEWYLRKKWQLSLIHI